jgi:hypothetical protein
MADQQISPRKIMTWILAGLVLWGVLHAVGAYLFNYNPWRALVVLTSFALFIGLWLAAISLRERRISRR